jgi:hypothetical protein
MKTPLVITVAVLALSMFAPADCICDTYTSDPDLRTYDGYVSAVDLQAQTLTIQGAIDLVFPISPDTAFKQDDNEIKLSDLEIGDYVKVEYYRLGIESRVPLKVIRVTLKYKGYGV